jgi:Predicted membrane protein
VRLLSFLQRELAPAPGRLRAALRITVSALTAVLVTVTVGGDYFPHGHWTIVTIFIVSQADAGASLRKSFQRVIGTLIGGGLGILAVIAFVDIPAFYVPLLAAVVTFGIFASLTTSAAYVMLLGSLTFVLVTFVPPGAGAAEAGG